MNYEKKHLGKFANLVEAKLSKVVHRIGAFGIAVALGFSLNSCNFHLPEDPSYNNNQNNNENNEDNNQNNNQNNSDGQLDWSQYSELLQNVLTNDYYDSLMTQAAADYKFLSSGAFQPHPYAFLEKEGYDVKAIQNKEIEAYTMSFVLDSEPNNLYMFTRVTDPTNTYHTNYILKYHLTDEEMDDYNLLNGGYPGHVDIHYYIQAVFLNNEISKMKTPEIVGTGKIAINSLKKMTKSFQDLVPYTNDFDISADLIFSNLNIENKTFDFYVFPNYRDDSKIVFKNKFYKVPCEFYLSLNINNGVYIGPADYNNYDKIDEEIKRDYATFYLPQDVVLSWVEMRDFETSDRPNK